MMNPRNITHPQSIVDLVRRLAIRGDSYADIADAVKRAHKIRFTKNNVAGMVHRLRKRGDLEPTKRVGGNQCKRPTLHDARPPAPITLPLIPRSRFHLSKQERQAK